MEHTEWPHTSLNPVSIGKTTQTEESFQGTVFKLICVFSWCLCKNQHRVRLEPTVPGQVRVAIFFLFLPPVCTMSMAVQVERGSEAIGVEPCLPLSPWFSRIPSNPATRPLLISALSPPPTPRPKFHHPFSRGAPSRLAPPLAPPPDPWILGP